MCDDAFHHHSNTRAWLVDGCMDAVALSASLLPACRHGHVPGAGVVGVVSQDVTQSHALSRRCGATHAHCAMMERAHQADTRIMSTSPVPRRDCYGRTCHGNRPT